MSENPILKVYAPKISKKLLPAITQEQCNTLLNHCRNEKDKAIISLLWYSGMRLFEITNVKARDFDWANGTVIILGKGNKYRKAVTCNGIVKEWFNQHETFNITRGGIQTMLKRLAKATGIHCNPHSFRRGFCVHNIKSGLSTRVVQVLGGWEQLTMVEHYSKSLTFDDAINMYNHINHKSV
ncbi:tyrosine-type recombinase/integrase [Chloroflexota bacterium]